MNDHAQSQHRAAAERAAPHRKEEVRRALDPSTGQPIPHAFETKSAEAKQFLQGKMTFIGLLLTLAGTLGKLFGWEVPAAEVNGFLAWLLASWDSLTQGIGLIIAFYGRLRQNWRE